MIKEASLWQGEYLSTYKDELDAWLFERRIGQESARRISLIDIDLQNPDWDNNELHDEAVWFEPARVIVIDHIEIWGTDPIEALAARLNGLDTEFTVAFIQRFSTKTTDELQESLKAIQTSLTEKPRDHGIYSNVEGLSAWIIEWLDSRDVGLSKSAARKLAEHCREDVATAVLVCQQLALGYKGYDAEWSDIEPQLGALGEVSIFDLTKAIVAGDREEAITVARRIASIPGLHPLQPMTMLSNRYRQYAAVVDSPLSPAKLAVKLKMKSEWGLKFAIREAKLLGKERVIRSYMLIGQVERDMKGGSRLDNWFMLELLVLKLAQQFRMAS